MLREYTIYVNYSVFMYSIWTNNLHNATWSSTGQAEWFELEGTL